jgi:hypothetical protein
VHQRAAELLSVATSPVAAIKSGGPARNARERSRTITM